MRPLHEYSNFDLVKRHKTLMNQSSKLINWFCENGFGALTPSAMRTMDAPPKQILKYLAIMDACADLRIEAQRRYGPNLMFMWEILR